MTLIHPDYLIQLHHADLVRQADRHRLAALVSRPRRGGPSNIGTAARLARARVQRAVLNAARARVAFGRDRQLQQRPCA